MKVIVSKSKIKIIQREVNKDHVYAVSLLVGVSTHQVVSCVWASVAGVTLVKVEVSDSVGAVVGISTGNVWAIDYATVPTRFKKFPKMLCSSLLSLVSFSCASTKSLSVFASAFVATTFQYVHPTGTYSYLCGCIGTSIINHSHQIVKVDILQITYILSQACNVSFHSQYILWSLMPSLASFKSQCQCINECKVWGKCNNNGVLDYPQN